MGSLLDRISKGHSGTPASETVTAFGPDQAITKAPGTPSVTMPATWARESASGPGDATRTAPACPQCGRRDWWLYGLDDRWHCIWCDGGPTAVSLSVMRDLDSEWFAWISRDRECVVVSVRHQDGPKTWPDAWEAADDVWERQRQALEAAAIVTGLAVINRSAG